VQQLWQGRPFWQGLPHPYDGSDMYHSLGPSSEPTEERGQHASGIEKSLCHDWSRDSRLR